MAVSPRWSTEEAFDGSWSVAQIHAPFPDVTSALAKSRNYRDSKQSRADTTFTVTNQDRSPLIAYAIPSSDWTFLECIEGVINYTSLIRISKTAKTDLLVADYCDDPCGMGYGHFRNGRLVEQYMTIDPEWPETRALDGKERKWKTDSAQTQCIFGKRESVLDIETNRFADWWNDVSESLNLNIPYRRWTAWTNDDNVGVDITEAPSATHAHLFTAI